jgi:hypothetical protein
LVTSTQGSNRSRFNLEAESRRFANDLQSLLNNTVCKGVSLTSIITEDDPTRAVVGYRITKRTFADIRAIPITISNRPPKLYLGLSMRLAPDRERRYLMVVSSVTIVATAKDVEDEANILLHSDYERDKGDGYPEAHMHLQASSGAWDSVRRLDGTDPFLHELHLPVGGRRFRPILEDLIDFLVYERLVHTHPQCGKTIVDRRDAFYEKQLRAAVRRNPVPAIEQLREDGYDVPDANEK